MCISEFVVLRNNVDYIDAFVDIGWLTGWRIKLIGIFQCKQFQKILLDSVTACRSRSIYSETKICEENKKKPETEQRILFARNDADDDATHCINHGSYYTANLPIH